MPLFFSVCARLSSFSCSAISLLIMFSNEEARSKFSSLISVPDNSELATESTILLLVFL